ncbi:glycosyltransferase family 32 protein [Acetilactobacillus jinshanensis]|uniref:Uncharacterized protein n=1 Tax=Acetilactobacillus jinshanensis TaxID=1720083 RepID=A0A4P6ZL04_9LACO|nr:glycosyltransferase [Acetilactobacillus jinshanensis]QBP18328.1 hypothetical protein ELX58_04070 [Acetilactobacillus jinshanensis]URL61193.1 hypothetical protein HGK75_04135 [uncultured bacterium]
MNEIPNVIHYSWFEKGAMPQDVKDNIQSWKRCCPKYKLICWTPKNFNVNKKLFTRRAAKQQNWSAISDYVRLMALRQMGGVYLNVHTRMFKSLDPLMHRQSFIGLSRPGAISANPIWAAKPMDKNVTETLDFVNRIAKRNDLESRLNDQPYITSAHFLKYALAPQDDKQLINHCSVFPTSYFHAQTDDNGQPLDSTAYTSYTPQHQMAIGHEFKARVHYYLKHMI